MAGNQFAVYQLREIPENRKKRFRSYAELQKEHIQIRYTDYKQVAGCGTMKHRIISETV